jgi:hypothetical protein
MLQSLVQCATADDGRFVIRDANEASNLSFDLPTSPSRRQWREYIGQYCPEAPSYVHIHWHDLVELTKMTDLSELTGRSRIGGRGNLSRHFRQCEYDCLLKHGYTREQVRRSRLRIWHQASGVPYVQLTLAEYTRLCWRFDWLYAAFLLIWFRDPNMTCIDLNVWIRYIVRADNLQCVEANFPPLLKTRDYLTRARKRLDACRALLTRRELDISPDMYTLVETNHLAASRSALVDCAHLPAAIVDCIVLPYIAPVCVWPPVPQFF